jgi:hypothetical protein
MKQAAQVAGIFLAAVFLVCPLGMLGQSTFGSIRGTVSDPTGAAVPGATATLRSIDQSGVHTVVSDSTGTFDFENLNPGRYALSVVEQGFAETNMNGIVLEARQTLRVPVTLSLSVQTTTVEVSATAEVINTEDASISDSKSNALITELPLNNRATTTSPLGALAVSPNVQQDSSGNVAVDGASYSMTNYSVDGISTDNVRQNGPLQDAYPSQEGIAGVKVTAFNNSAEFSQVADVTFTTKAGTNKFHGSLFEYLQNDALDAIPYGASSKAPKHFNTFGGSLGGPVTIPRFYSGKNTFFFFDYEGNRRATATLQQAAVPSLQDRTGNLSDLCDSTPITNINPTATALLNYIPKPNTGGLISCTNGVSVIPGGFNYENFQPIPSSTDGADVRVDQNLGAKNQLYARFSRKNINSSVANLFLPDDVDSIHNRSLLVSDTESFTNHLVNEFRYGFTYVTTSVNFPIQGSTALQQLDLAGVDISQHLLTHAFPTFNFSAGTGFSPIGRDKAGITQSRTTQFSDNLTYTIGKHTLKGGIDVRRVRYFDLESFAPEFASDDFGDFSFQGGYTGNGFGDLLMGVPTTEFFAVSSPDVGGTATQFSFFAQDEWQIAKRLTLSYGLRWQVLPSFVEDGGNLANFDQNNNAIVVPDNLATYLQQQNIVSSNLAFQQSFNACNLNVKTVIGANGTPVPLPCTNYETASQDGLPAGLRQTYKGDLQPRIAFAYRPFNDTKTVIRGGFGIYTMTNLGPLSFNNSGNPTSNLHIYSNTPSPTITFPNTQPPSTGGPVIGGGGLDQGVDPNYRDPQSSQWSVTIERQITPNNSLRASYVGTHSYRLNLTEDLNQIHASTVAYDTGATQGVYVDTRAPYQNWTVLLSTFNAGMANYNAFELEATHRMAKGLYYDVNYTLAKNLADNQGSTPSSFAGEVNYGTPITDRFNVRSDYGNEEGTRRHRVLLTGQYELPFGVGRQFLGKKTLLSEVIGGWNLNTVTLLETGPWLTPSISPGQDQSNTNVANRGATLRPDVVSRSFYQGQSRAQYFNPVAFAATPSNAGRFGNAGVGILQGPGAAAVSLGLAKVILINDAVHLRFESTFTNVLNHTNFAPPSTQIDGGTFGQLTTATTAENAGNRTGQVALRLEF